VLEDDDKSPSFSIFSEDEDLPSKSSLETVGVEHAAMNAAMIRAKEIIEPVLSKFVMRCFPLLFIWNNIIIP
jgi:hypothetical protein